MMYTDHMYIRYNNNNEHHTNYYVLILIFKKVSHIRSPSPTHEAEWNQFQTHYFSENLVAPETEPGPLDV
jgi:hypothetical protein